VISIGTGIPPRHESLQRELSIRQPHGNTIIGSRTIRRSRTTHWTITDRYFIVRHKTRSHIPSTRLGHPRDGERLVGNSQPSRVHQFGHGGEPGIGHGGNGHRGTETIHSLDETREEMSREGARGMQGRKRLDRPHGTVAQPSDIPKVLYSVRCSDGKRRRIRIGAGGPGCLEDIRTRGDEEVGAQELLNLISPG